MSKEILFQPIKDVLLVHVAEDTLVKVWTMAGNESFYMVGVQRDLPHSRKLSSGACLGFAFVRNGIIKGVGPDWGIHRRDTHGAVPYETIIYEDIILNIKARLQSGCTHT